MITNTERAVIAAEMLTRFLRHREGHGRIAHRVYGLFQGDLMLSWTLSRSYAQRMARETYWDRTEVRHIGTVKPTGRA